MSSDTEWNDWENQRANGDADYSQGDWEATSSTDDGVVIRIDEQPDRRGSRRHAGDQRPRPFRPNGAR